MKIEIKSWLTGSVLVEGDFFSVEELITDAVRKGADLTGAYLKDADLKGADLTGADLTGADLTGAYLTDAYLTDADLKGAYLKGAYLTGADLTDADLKGADLTDAYLTGADLKGADLTDADLTGADLTGADLTPIRDDLWAVLSSSPAEVPALRAAIVDGRINGRVYEGECCCLVGTLAKARAVKYTDIPGLSPEGGRPAERWFLNIEKGQKPDTNQFSALTLQWVDEWLNNMKSAAKAGAFEEVAK